MIAYGFIICSMIFCNEHNYKNRKMSEKELCEFYCLGIHKRLNSSRHHVHWLASISNKSFTKESSKPQATSLDTVTFLLLSLCLHCHLHCALSISIHVGDCWKNSIEWIRNWCVLYSLEDVIISDENPWVLHWK